MHDVSIASICLHVEGWCPACDSDVQIGEEILALEPGSAVRVSTGFWILTGVGDEEIPPVLLHKECAKTWLGHVCSEAPVIALGNRDTGGTVESNGM